MEKQEKYLNSNIIYNNSFTPELIDIVGKILYKKELGDSDIYIMNVFNYIVEICDKFEDLNYIYLYISNYPKNPIFRKKILNKDFIRYHTEIYVINIVALFDRCLQLINFIYNLNLNGLKLKFDNVKKELEKIDKSILLALTSFYNDIEKVRPTQNHIKHKGKLDLIELDKINNFDFLLKHSKDLNDDLVKNMSLYIKLGIKDYKKTHKINFLENNKIIAEHINNFFTEIYPVFKRKLEK